MEKKIIISYKVKINSNMCSKDCPYLGGMDFPFCELFKENLSVKSGWDMVGLRCRRCLAATENNQEIEMVK